MSYGIELECHVIVRKVINLDILKYAFALFGVGLGTPLSLIKSNFWMYFLLCRLVNHPENWKCSFSSKQVCVIAPKQSFSGLGSLKAPLLLRFLCISAPPSRNLSAINSLKVFPTRHCTESNVCLVCVATKTNRQMGVSLRGLEGQLEPQKIKRTLPLSCIWVKS